MTPDPEPPDLPDVPVVESVAAEQVAAQVEATAPVVEIAPGHHTPLHTHCENCGTELQGPFCSKCGQHDFDFKQGFGHALHDALENIFHFDTKLFRNTVTLLFRPGLLTAEFNAGHRVAQMPPLRFYIFVSILFFLISFTGDRVPKDVMINDGDHAAPKKELRIGAGPKLESVLAEIKKDVAQAKQDDADDKAEKSADLATVKPEKGPTTKETKSALEKTLEERGEYAFRHQHELAEAFIHAVPKMLLFCLPLFALYTRVLFRKSGLAYLQHLVIAVHFHTFIFLFLLFRDGWVALTGLLSSTLAGWVTFAAGVWLFLYPILMTRRLFGHAYKRTLLRTAVLAVAYTVTIVLAFFITALIVLATI